LIVYVVDASVASRFLLIEDWSDNATSLLRNFASGTVDLRAPELVNYEVGNTLWKAVRRKLLTFEEAVEKLSDFMKLRLSSIQLNEEECRDALAWGVKNDATYYDSVYVIASKKIGAVLMTADRTLYQKASKEVTAVQLSDI
jgi:predicted nucleic acid-binding protein